MNYRRLTNLSPMKDCMCAAGFFTISYYNFKKEMSCIASNRLLLFTYIYAKLYHQKHATHHRVSSINEVK